LTAPNPGTVEQDGVRENAEGFVPEPGEVLWHAFFRHSIGEKELSLESRAWST
jgi:hypothetical protein